MAKRKQKTKTQLKKDLWKVFSLHQKLVYSEDGQFCQCYTCDRTIEIGTSGCHGGHCLSKAAHSILYFDERAVRPQCYYCNINLGGNEYEFNERLKLEIGLNDWSDMYDSRFGEFKVDKFWYLDKLEYYKSQVLELKEARGIL